MATLHSEPIAIARRLTSDVVTVGGYNLRPVAQAQGEYRTVAGEHGAAAWGRLGLKPVEVFVEDRQGRAYSVTVSDVTETVLRRILLTAMTVAGICSFMIAISRLFIRRT